MIYYTSSSGTIIGGTAGSDLTGITHLPSGADYAILIDDATVSSLNPNNAPGTYTMTNITPGPVYTVPTATGTLTFTEQPAAEQLANAQQAQIALLNAGLQATLAGGFTAKTLVGGATSPHTYPTNASAQSNFSAAVNAFITNANKTSVTVETLDAGWVSHTKDEFFGIYTDGDNWKEAQYAQYNNLVAQVNAATTVEAVQAITWSEASY